MVSDAFIATVESELGQNWSKADKKTLCSAILRAAILHLPEDIHRSPLEDKKAKQNFDAMIGAIILGKAPLHG